MNEAGIQAYFHRVHLSILLKKIYLPTKDYNSVWIEPVWASYKAISPADQPQDSLRVSVCKIQFKSCEQHAAYKLNKPSDLQ